MRENISLFRQPTLKRNKQENYHPNLDCTNLRVVVDEAGAIDQPRAVEGVRGTCPSAGTIIPLPPPRVGQTWIVALYVTVTKSRIIWKSDVHETTPVFRKESFSEI